MIKKPHLFFFSLIPLFIILGIVKRNIPIDIRISYIHYLINIDFWCYITAVYFGLMGINYFSLQWVKKTLNKWLTLTHIVLQTICIIPYLIAIFNLDETGNLTYQNIPFQKQFGFVLLISFVLFLVSVLLHLINFFSALLLKKD